MSMLEPAFDLEQHPDLSADCAACFGLCCIALRFSRSDGFGHDKPAGIACQFLEASYRCAIHPRREDLGYEGCETFSCRGAGQRAAKAFAGTAWQTNLAIARQLYARFTTLLKLQELRYVLLQAEELNLTAEMEARRLQILRKIVQLADGKQMGGQSEVGEVVEQANRFVREMKG